MLYDKRPGGLGLCGLIYRHRVEILKGMEKLLSGCDCENGCPACVLSNRFMLLYLI